MLCVIKEIYSVYTSFICNCTGGFYSLKLWFIWTFTSQTHKFQLHLKGHRLKQLPHLNRSPTKKSKTLIPHPSPVLMRSSDESNWLWKLKVYPTEMLFPSLGSSLPLHWEKLCGETSREPNLTWKCWDGNLRIRKSRVKFVSSGTFPKHQGAAFSFFTSPINDGSLRFFRGWWTRGAPSNYEWSVITPI